MTYFNIQDALRDNQRKYCEAAGCRKYRKGLSRFCGKHRSRMRRWLHEKGLGLRHYHYIKEKELAKRLVVKNHKHKGVKRALDYFDVLLRRAESNWEKVPAKRFLRSLNDFGVSAEDMLIEAVAVGLYYFSYWREPRRRIKDVENFKAVLGSRLLRTIPTKVFIPHEEYQELGKAVHSAIGVLLLNFGNSLDDAKAKKRKEREDYSSPLDI